MDSFLGSRDVTVGTLSHACELRNAERRALVNKYSAAEFEILKKTEVGPLVADMDFGLLLQLLENDQNKPNDDGLVTYDHETLENHKDALDPNSKRPLLGPQTHFSRLRDPSVTLRFPLENESHADLAVKLAAAHSYLSMIVMNQNDNGYFEKKRGTPLHILQQPHGPYSHHANSMRIEDPSPGEKAYYFHPVHDNGNLFTFHHNNSTYFDELCA
jgi:hypothetical protein